MFFKFHQNFQNKIKNNYKNRIKITINNIFGTEFTKIFQDLKIIFLNNVFYILKGKIEKHLITFLSQKLNFSNQYI